MQALSSYRGAHYSVVLHRSPRDVYGHVRCARQQCNSSRKRHVTTASMEEEAHRNTVKNLTRLFCECLLFAVTFCTGAIAYLWWISDQALLAADGPSTATPQQPGSSQPRRPRVLKGSQIPNLPLWRVEWAVLPGMQVLQETGINTTLVSPAWHIARGWRLPAHSRNCDLKCQLRFSLQLLRIVHCCKQCLVHCCFVIAQEILHVLAPHYVHMFEVIFSRSRPWVFGHLYLPGGSKSLGQPTHALASGSKAPLVGVLMQVTRAVRLRDGKFLLLATALGRFKVRQTLLSSCQGGLGNALQQWAAMVGED